MVEFFTQLFPLIFLPHQTHATFFSDPTILSSDPTPVIHYDRFHTGWVEKMFSEIFGYLFVANSEATIIVRSNFKLRKKFDCLHYKLTLCNRIEGLTPPKAPFIS